MTDVFLRYLQVLPCAVVQMFLYATEPEEQSCGCCSVLAGSPCSDGCAECCVLVPAVCATPEPPMLPPGSNFLEPHLCVGGQTGL